MNQYLVTLYLKEIDVLFMQLIPAHREMINNLLLKEVIETYAVNTERSKGWITINATDEVAVIEYIDKFPIRNYFSYDIDQLFIFENAMALMPKVVLN